MPERSASARGTAVERSRWSTKAGEGCACVPSSIAYGGGAGAVSGRLAGTSPVTPHGARAAGAGPHSLREGRRAP